MGLDVRLRVVSNPDSDPSYLVFFARFYAIFLVVFLSPLKWCSIVDFVGI